MFKSYFFLKTSLFVGRHTFSYFLKKIENLIKKYRPDKKPVLSESIGSGYESTNPEKI